MGTILINASTGIIYEIGIFEIVMEQLIVCAKESCARDPGERDDVLIVRAARSLPIDRNRFRVDKLIADFFQSSDLIESSDQSYRVRT